MNSTRFMRIIPLQLGRLLAAPLAGCTATIWLTGCVTADHSGAAVVAQWNARFNANAGATPWSSAPTTSVRDFVYEGLAVKDYEYKRYVDLIRRGTSWSGFGAQTATIGLNTAGALTTSGTTKVLSGVAGAITGTSAAFSKNVLFDQSITTFVGRMDALRAEKLAHIQKRLTETDYGFAEAYRDIEDYGHKGSLDAALADVAKKSGIEEATAKGEIQPTASAKSKK